MMKTTTMKPEHHPVQQPRTRITHEDEGEGKSEERNEESEAEEKKKR
jgi:hypothetical protein